MEIKPGRLEGVIYFGGIALAFLSIGKGVLALFSKNYRQQGKLFGLKGWRSASLGLILIIVGVILLWFTLFWMTINVF